MGYNPSFFQHIHQARPFLFAFWLLFLLFVFLFFSLFLVWLGGFLSVFYSTFTLLGRSSRSWSMFPVCLSNSVNLSIRLPNSLFSALLLSWSFILSKSPWIAWKFLSTSSTVCWNFSKSANFFSKSRKMVSALSACLSIVASTFLISRSSPLTSSFSLVTCSIPL